MRLGCSGLAMLAASQLGEGGQLCVQSWTSRLPAARSAATAMASEPSIAALPEALLLRVLQLAAASDASALFLFPRVCKQWRTALSRAEDAFWASCFHLCFGERIAFWSTVEQLPPGEFPPRGLPNILGNPEPHSAWLSTASGRQLAVQNFGEDEINQAKFPEPQHSSSAWSSGEASWDAHDTSSTWKHRLKERMVAGRGWEAGRRQECLVSMESLRRVLQECGKLSPAEQELSRSPTYPLVVSALKLECNLLFIALTGFTPETTELSAIIVWDLERATHVSVCVGHTSFVALLDVDRWCRFLLSGSIVGGEMCLWCVASGMCLARLEGEPTRPVTGLGGGGWGVEVTHVMESMRWIDPDYSGVTQEDGTPQRLVPKDRDVEELTDWLAARRRRDALGKRSACFSAAPCTAGNECTAEMSCLGESSNHGGARNCTLSHFARSSDVSSCGGSCAAPAGPGPFCTRCRAGPAGRQGAGSAACRDELPARQAGHGCSPRCRTAAECAVLETLEWVTMDDSRSATLWRVQAGEARPVPAKRFPGALSFDSRSGVLVVRGASPAEVRLVDVRTGAELRSIVAPDAASRAHTMGRIASPCGADLAATVPPTQSMAIGQESRASGEGEALAESTPSELVASDQVGHANEQTAGAIDGRIAHPEAGLAPVPNGVSNGAFRPPHEQAPAAHADPIIEEAYLSFSDSLGWGLLLVLANGEVVLTDADRGHALSCIRFDPLTEACHTFSLLGRVSCVIHPLDSPLDDTAQPLGFWDLEAMVYHSFDSLAIAGAWDPLHIDSLIAGRACATSVWVEKGGDSVLLWTEPGGHAPRVPMQCAYELEFGLSDANWRWLVLQSSQGILANDFLVPA